MSGSKSSGSRNRNPLEVTVVVQSPRLPLSPRIIAARTRSIASALHLTRGAIAVALVNEGRMRMLSRRFLRKKNPTNVMSFCYARSGPHVEADILLCPAVIFREARALKTTPRSRLAQLLIHAMVHVKGLDHQTRARERAMQRQEQKLTSLFL